MAPVRIINRIVGWGRRAGGYTAVVGKGNIKSGDMVIAGRRGTNTDNSSSAPKRRRWYHIAQKILGERGAARRKTTGATKK